jgi:hypothetical protein
VAKWQKFASCARHAKTSAKHAQMQKFRDSLARFSRSEDFDMRVARRKK